MSRFVLGADRNQTSIFCLNELVSADNEVRLIDLFVDSCQFAELGFKTDFVENGRPAYHPGVLLKLFIYGYMNRIRSSRQLEKECRRNLELMWLMKGLAPDHNTIANFRKHNPKQLENVFRTTVKVAQNFELIGGKLLAGDSTKLRAQNSKKNNFNAKKIERHIAYIDQELRKYSQALAQEDGDVPLKEETVKRVNRHLTQREKYEQMRSTLSQSEEVQISTSDPDSRQLITRNNITEVGYNVQTTVDAKHNLPVDFKVTNKNDSKAMGNMVRRAKTILGHSDFTVLYDKGYHTGSEFAYAQAQGVEVIVAYPEVASHAPDKAFDVEQFKYDKENDSYTCPAGAQLQTNGRWYNKASGKTINSVKHYKTKACMGCALFERCTKNKHGRLIERSEHMDLIEANKARHDTNENLYRRRQAIVEHPYGIIKRQWDFYYIMSKRGMQRAKGDVGMIFTAFNLRRLFNILSQRELKTYLRGLFHYFKSKMSQFKWKWRTNSSAVQNNWFKLFTNPSLQIA